MKPCMKCGDLFETVAAKYCPRCHHRPGGPLQGARGGAKHAPPVVRTCTDCRRSFLGVRQAKRCPACRRARKAAQVAAAGTRRAARVPRGISRPLLTTCRRCQGPVFTLRRCGVLATRIVCPPCVAEAEAKAAAWEQGQKEAKAKREAAREAKAERERAWKEHRAALAAERERKQAEKVAARKAAEAERQEKREAREAEKRKRREARELLEEIQASHADRALLLLEIRDLRRQVEVMLAEWRGEFPEAPPATPAREWGRGGVGWDYPA